uniref:E3 ubiquitin/ISG15 ligase TRIM25-like n=1 Tax=Myxine glutinosa TaxID=7769 RepID=UPI00358F8A6F
MASSSDFGVILDELTCPVCFDLYKEPTALPCGHSFCRVCIETFWENRKEDTGCVCPNCREVFPQKPKLEKNVIVANLVENMKLKKGKVGLGVEIGDAEHGNVNVKEGVKSGGSESYCELCNGEAAKRCVPCEILCCEKHLKPHQQKGHKLVDPEVKIEELRCTQHGKPIQLYCKDDESLMCLMCTGGQHQEHKVVAVEIAHVELKGVLAAKYPHVSQSMESVASQLQQVQEEEEQTENSSRDAEDRLEEKRMLVCQFVNESVDVMKSQINKRKMEKLSLFGKQREKLEQQMENLREGKSTMDKAFQELEAVSFLQGSKNMLKRLRTMSDFKSMKRTPLPVLDFSKEEKTLDGLVTLNKKFMEKIQKGPEKVYLQHPEHLFPVEHPERLYLEHPEHLFPVEHPERLYLEHPEHLFPVEHPEMLYLEHPEHLFPVEHPEMLYLQHPEHLFPVEHPEKVDLDQNNLRNHYGRTPSLDPNSAHRLFEISRSLRTATRTVFENPYPKHPDRFDFHTQVVSRESFSSSRHYWEVDVRSCRFCRIGICLNSMGRKRRGRGCMLGRNPESWCLEKRDNEYSAFHDDQCNDLSVPRDPERFGFFLDCEAGELTCFGDSRVLCVFVGNFMVPVKPAIGVLNDGDSVHFVRLVK